MRESVLERLTSVHPNLEIWYGLSLVHPPANSYRLSCFPTRFTFGITM